MKKRNHFHRLQRKQYSRGGFRNPYFQPKKGDYRAPLFLGGAIFVLGCFFLVYLFAYPAFSLQRVEIRGLEPASNAQMEEQVRQYLNERRFLFFHRTNRFLFSEKGLKEHLSQTFAFDELTVRFKKQLLTLTVKERTSDIIWQTNGEGYLADLTGIITKKIEGVSTDQKLPLFVDRNNAAVAIGETILSAAQIENILSFHKLLAEQSIVQKETQFDLKTGKWIGILTQTGYTILFDPDSDLTAQAEALRVILRDTIKDTSNLQYIDLRFKDRVYYK